MFAIADVFDIESIHRADSTNARPELDRLKPVCQASFSSTRQGGSCKQDNIHNLRMIILHDNAGSTSDHHHHRTRKTDQAHISVQLSYNTKRYRRQTDKRTDEQTTLPTT